MRRFICCLMAIAITRAAGAFPWNPANCTVPSQIRVVTWNGVAPDSASGRISVTVRNSQMQPVFGSSVVIRFADVPELHLAADQQDPAVTVQCAERSVRKLTAADGSARFTIMGNGVAALPTAGPIRAQIFADGVWLGDVPVAILDIDGVNGLGANDVSIWINDFGSLRNPGRGDFDANGILGANDLSLLAEMFGRSGSALSVPAACP